ncbi:MAG: glycoside hydrolase [Gemmatimonadetes bacterium]|nr:glycoside hydrolase [Gemmatimonadota bacterium]
MTGYLALVLHAHLPFVRHPEHERFLEEDWFFEAITETYLPLLDMFERLIRDGVDFRMTMSMTPPLISMLDDELLRSRYLAHVDRLIELSTKEIERTRREDPAFQELAWWYHRYLSRTRWLFSDRFQCDLVGAFARIQDLGRLEIITCGATHGFLPLLRESPAAVRAQIMVARDHYFARFGRPPRGIWLPECAYFPGLEELLRESEIRFFMLDTHGVRLAEPRPRYGCHAPVYTPAGPAAFARDPESSSEVWSAEAGYPGNAVYRDFYRDLGYDRDEEYIAPYIHPDGIRIFTGIKYFAVSGRGKRKLPYNRVWALAKAADHAQDFLDKRRAQMRGIHSVLGRPPIVVAPYDAELFGHWWFEGPMFIEYLLRKIHHDQDDIVVTTPYEYLAREPIQQVANPATSSWGEDGYWKVWLNEKNDWIYPHLHRAGSRLQDQLRRRRSGASAGEMRVLRQMARELLLAQSSDWAFLINAGTATEYATKRFRTHVARFERLDKMLVAGAIDQEDLVEIEGRDNIFPRLDLRHWR